MTEVLTEPDLARISRSHAKISFDGVRLNFEDLGSSNGSTIAIWDPNNLRLSNNQRISDNQKVVIQPRDLIVLAGVLEIQRSGRRFPFDLAQPGSNPNSNTIRVSPKTRLFKGD